jgi:RNA polymerase sigma-70 factor (ECF subfamily)
MGVEGEMSEGFPWARDEAELDWDVVYAELLPRVYNFFRYRLGNETQAEDLTSRTFEKAWTGRARYRRDLAGFSTWLFTIARNVAVDHLRARRPHLPLEAADHVAAPGTPQDDAAHASDLERLASLLQRLPAREQEIVALKYGAEATNRAIAALLGLSESNVGTILHRVVRELRSAW